MVVKFNKMNFDNLKQFSQKLSMRNNYVNTVSNNLTLTAKLENIKQKNATLDFQIRQLELVFLLSDVR